MWVVGKLCAAGAGLGATCFANGCIVKYIRADVNPELTGILEPVRSTFMSNPPATCHNAPPPAILLPGVAAMEPVAYIFADF